MGSKWRRCNQQKDAQKSGFIERFKNKHPFASDAIVVFVALSGVISFVIAAFGSFFPDVLDVFASVLTDVSSGRAARLLASLARRLAAPANQPFDVFVLSWSIVIVSFALAKLHDFRNDKRKGDCAKLAWNHFFTSPMVVAILVSLYIANKALGASHILRDPATGLTMIIVAVFAGLGALLVVTARLQLGSSWEAGICISDTEPPLVKRGVYALVRHPLYAGLDVMYVSSAYLLFNGDLLPLLVAVFGCILNCLRARREEVVMEQRHGDYWRTFKGKTPFMFPALK